MVPSTLPAPGQVRLLILEYALDKCVVRVPRDGLSQSSIRRVVDGEINDENHSM